MATDAPTPTPTPKATTQETTKATTEATTKVTTVATTKLTTTKATTASPTPKSTKPHPLPTPPSDDCGLISIEKKLIYPHCSREFTKEGKTSLLTTLYPEYLQYDIIVKRRGALLNQRVQILETVPAEFEYDTFYNAPGYSATSGSFDRSTGIWTLEPIKKYGNDESDEWSLHENGKRGQVGDSSSSSSSSSSSDSSDSTSATDRSDSDDDNYEEKIQVDVLALFFVVYHDRCNHRTIENCARILKIGDESIIGDAYHQNKNLKSCETVHFEVSKASTPISPPKHEQSDSDDDDDDSKEKCKERIGCDGVHGSCAKFDRCGVCNGLDDKCTVKLPKLVDRENVLQETSCSITNSGKTGFYNFELGGAVHVDDFKVFKFVVSFDGLQSHDLNHLGNCDSNNGNQGNIVNWDKTVGPDGYQKFNSTINIDVLRDQCRTSNGNKILASYYNYGKYFFCYTKN